MIFPMLDLDATETYWFIAYCYPAVVTYSVSYTHLTLPTKRIV